VLTTELVDCEACWPLQSRQSRIACYTSVDRNAVTTFDLLWICYIQRPVWARERCRISPPRFVAEYCNRRLNHGSFVLLYFRLFTFSDLYWVSLSVFSCTVLFVSISQVIVCEDRLRNDLYCVEWGVKLYSNRPTNQVIYNLFVRLCSSWQDFNWRSASRLQLAELPVPPVRLATFGSRAFPVAAAHIWNSLPEHTVSASTLQSFKRHLKTFLLQQSFRLAL